MSSFDVSSMPCCAGLLWLAPLTLSSLSLSLCLWEARWQRSPTVGAVELGRAAIEQQLRRAVRPVVPARERRHSLSRSQRRVCCVPVVNIDPAREHLGVHVHHRRRRVNSEVARPPAGSRSPRSPATHTSAHVGVTTQPHGANVQAKAQSTAMGCHQSPHRRSTVPSARSS